MRFTSADEAIPILGRIIVTIFCAGVAAAVSAFIPVFFNINKSLPVLSLCTAQLALVFMFVLLAFPKANYKGLMRMSRYYISFLVINFSLLTFLPVPEKLFAFGEITDTVTWLPFMFPELVTTNISSLVCLNILSFLFLAILPQDATESVRVPEGRMAANQQVSFEEDLIIHAPNDLEFVGEVNRAPAQPRPQQEQSTVEQMNVLEEVLSRRAAEQAAAQAPAPGPTLSADQIAFLQQIGASEEIPTAPAPQPATQAVPQGENLGSVYNAETATDGPASKAKLEQLEQTLLNNIDFKIEEALCMNTNGESLDDTIFHWHGNKAKMLEIFERFNHFSEGTGSGGLCQLAFKQGRDWYMVSKYQGSFLVLRTSHPEPAPVLETTYRVLTQI